MVLHLTDEQIAIRNTFARFTDEQIIPNAEAIDVAHEYPRDIVKQLADLGFVGMRYPEEVGGSNVDLVTFCLCVEQIARGSMSVAGCISMQSLMGTKFLEMLGNDDIKERLFKPALALEKIGAICMTEPNAGSDLGGLSTSATKVDGGYVLNGNKIWVTAAPLADFFTVFARVGEEKLLSIFLVEKEFDGISVGKTIEKMGVWVPTL